MKQTIKITIMLTPDEHSVISKYAARHRCTLAEAIRILISRSVTSEEFVHFTPRKKCYGNFTGKRKEN